MGEIRIYVVQDCALEWESHWNEIPMGMGITTWHIMGMRIKQRKRYFFKRLYTSKHFVNQN